MNKHKQPSFFGKGCERSGASLGNGRAARKRGPVQLGGGSIRRMQIRNRSRLSLLLTRLSCIPANWVKIFGARTRTRILVREPSVVRDGGREADAPLGSF